MICRGIHRYRTHVRTRDNKSKIMRLSENEDYAEEARTGAEGRLAAKTDEGRRAGAPAGGRDSNEKTKSATRRLKAYSEAIYSLGPNSDFIVRLYCMSLVFKCFRFSNKVRGLNAI